MAKSWHYPRWRRIVMQCVMWLVLAAAVAAAALLNHEIRRHAQVPLDQPQTLGSFRIRLPRGWTRSQEENRPGVLIHLTSPQEGAARRQLLILSQPTEAFIPPRVWLNRADDDPADARDAQAMTVGGYPGVMIVRRAQLTIGNHEPFDVGVIHACVVFPWRQTAEVYLLSTQSIEQADTDLVRDVAQSLQLVNRPGPSDRPVVHLQNMDMAVPTGWRIAGEDDPNRLAGQMLYATPEQWLSAEIIPCHVTLENSTVDQAIRLRTLAAVSGSQWQAASVTPETPLGNTRLWQLNLPTTQGFTQTARIVADNHGQGAIIFFRGYGTDDSVMDQAWHEMTTGLHLTGRDDWQGMLDQGRKTAEQWSRMTLDQLITTREDTWWLWYGSGKNPYIGWLNLQWLSVAADSAVPWRAVWESRMRPGDGSVIRRRQSIGSTAGMSDYSDAIEEWRTGTGGGAFVPAGRQAVLRRQNLLTFTSGPGTPQVIQQPAPPGFIGGGWLPLLLARCADKPTVFQSESFLFHQAQSAPLQVVVDPATTPSTRPAARILTIHVNGDGDLTRWTFGPDGELQSIQCTRGLQLLPATPQDLRVDFHGDGRMTP